MEATMKAFANASVVAARNAISLGVFVGALSSAALLHAAQIADWTFETTQPALTGSVAGPYSPEVGAGSATGTHALATAVYSSPAGNGTSHSFSSNMWSVGDNYQFQVSTVGLSNINFTWDQTSSSTGPRDFQLQYSTDGVSYLNFGAVISPIVNTTAGANLAWNATTNQPQFTFTGNLSAITAVDNAPAVYFRITEADGTAENGLAVATAGTDRVDNVIVSGTAIATPEPSSIVLAVIGLAGLTLAAKRRRRQ